MVGMVESLEFFIINQGLVRIGLHLIDFQYSDNMIKDCIGKVWQPVLLPD